MFELCKEKNVREGSCDHMADSCHAPSLTQTVLDDIRRGEGERENMNQSLKRSFHIQIINELIIQNQNKPER